MALLVYNITGSPITLAAGNPARQVPASTAPPARGPSVNVTSELRGLSGGDYTALEAQRPGNLIFAWTDDPEYSTGTLSVQSPTKPAVRSTSSTSITVADSDDGCLIRCTSGSAIGVSVPANLTPGTTVEFVQEGAGQITVTGSGVTIRVPAAFQAKTAQQWSSLLVTILDGDEALVRGDLSA